MRSFCLLLLGLVIVTLADETVKEKEDEFVMDIPEGMV